MGTKWWFLSPKKNGKKTLQDLEKLLEAIASLQETAVSTLTDAQIETVELNKVIEKANGLLQKDTS